MRLLRVLVVLSFCVFLFADQGQSSAQVATGVTSPYMEYQNRGFDTINIGNLNVYFSLPVFLKAGAWWHEF